MTDEEFARLFPNIKWPQTSEGRDSTYIDPVPKLPAAFSDPLITENTRAPLSIGSFRSRPTTPREILMDNLFRVYGDDSAARHRVDNLLVYPDFFGAPLFGAYDAPRALDEGRYKDATLSAITAAAPFLGKPTKMFAEAVRRRGLANAAIKGAEELPGGPVSDSKTGNNLSQNNLEETVIRRAEDDQIFDPPEVPQRPFEADYANGAEADATGKLRKDMDGRKLAAKHIIGRQTVDGPDIPGTPEIVEEVAEDLLGKKIRTVSPDEIEGDLGATDFRIPPGEPLDMRISNQLTRDQRNKVIGHEAAHILEEVAGQIPIDGYGEKLRFIHNTTATGKEGVAPKIPLERLYDAENVPHELMAEAIRTYIVNPNWLKTVAPEVAALIRKHVNAHPILSKIIQFNSLAAGAGGLALADQSKESNAQEAPLGKPMVSNALKMAYSIFGPSIPFELVSGGTKTASGIAEIAGALAQRGLAPQTPRLGKFGDIVRALLEIESRRKPPFYGPR